MWYIRRRRFIQYHLCDVPHIYIKISIKCRELACLKGHLLTEGDITGTELLLRGCHSLRLSKDQLHFGNSGSCQARNIRSWEWEKGSAPSKAEIRVGDLGKKRKERDLQQQQGNLESSPQWIIEWIPHQVMQHEGKDTSFVVEIPLSLFSL